MRILGRFVLIGAAWLGGCASAMPAAPDAQTATAAPSWRAWANQHGGLLNDAAAAARVTRLGESIIPNELSGRVQFHVLATHDATAFAGHDGHVFVTSALATQLDDAELTAAIAHELGHLVVQQGPAPLAALRGTPLDVEMRADAAGVAMLEAHGLSASNMARMLQKVHDLTPVGRSCRLLMQQRIAALQAH